jgi:hypothetical protein
MAASVLRAPSGPGNPTAEKVKKAKKKLRGSVEVQIKPAAIASRETMLKVVCSDTWAEDAEEAMRSGRVPRRSALGAAWRALWFSGFYPPRDKGRKRLMRVCPMCGVDCPPSPAEPVGLPGRAGRLCVDCRENHRAPPDREPVSELNLEDVTPRLMRFVAGAGMLGVIENTGDDAQATVQAEQLRRTSLRRLRAMLATHRAKPNLRRAIVLDGLELDGLLGQSYSAHIIGLLAAYNVSIPERRLAPEDEASLRREIAAAEAAEAARNVQKGGTKK